MKRALSLLLVLVFALSPAACTTAPAPAPKAEISFTHLPPILIDAARVEIVHEYRPTFTVPNVEHLFPVTPAAALERWASERLRPSGKAGTVRFIIMDASVRETKLATGGGIIGMVTKNPSERYDGSVRARAEVVDDQGRPLGIAAAYATRSQTVLEGISPNERTQVWFDLTAGIVNDFDKEMERNVRQLLGNWVR